MLRRILLSLSQDKRLRQWFEQSRLSQRLIARFVAGRSLEDEIRAVRCMAGEGFLATLDFLGENVTSLPEAAECRNHYLEALNRIRAGQLPASVSLKLSQFGLDLSFEACAANLRAVVESAHQIGTRVEIDMESSAYTERTLEVVRALHTACPGCVRAVIQAYLRRSESDIAELNALGIPVRLCKGAYREPEAIAFPSKADVDANYRKLMFQLLRNGVYPAIASHDQQIVRQAAEFAHANQLPPDRFEFQMLYGIRRDLQRELIAQGFRLRLYIPYGDAWYPYFMRRLAERPANVLFLLRNLLRR
jgi:proline dehydrogenase